MSRFAAIDLSLLPPPAVIETVDFEEILAAMIEDYKTRYPSFSALLESEPVMALLQANAWRETLLRARVNDAARAVMLPYAMGSDLDNLIALMGTERRVLDERGETLESDDEARARGQLAWEAQSVAGPTGAYLYHALSADPRVRDARVTSPTPGTVLVTLLSREGDGTAPDDLLTAVHAYLTDDTRRPLTDTVQVQSATIVPYEVRATLTIQDGPSASVVREAAKSALSATVTRLHALGAAVRQSAIYAALHVEGVARVVLTSPAADIDGSTTAAPYCVGISLTIGGGDD